jgi:hypothetical protein
VTYELVTEIEHMQKWDKMLLNLQVLERSPKQYPILRIGTFINTYGVPGEQQACLTAAAAAAAAAAGHETFKQHCRNHTAAVSFLQSMAVQVVAAERTLPSGNLLQCRGCSMYMMRNAIQVSSPAPSRGVISKLYVSQPSRLS